MEKRLVEKPWEVSKTVWGKRPLVLSIDATKFFCTKESPLEVAKMPGYELLRRSVDGQAKLIAAAREKNIQIIYTTIGFRKDGKDIGQWKIAKMTRLALEGTEWLDIVPELEPKEEDIVMMKKMPSAFWATDLLNIMVTNKYDTLILGGCNTSGCIRGTTIASFMHGYPTIIPHECVGDNSGEDAHWANLSDVNGRYADVVDLDDVLKYFKSLPMQK